MESHLRRRIAYRAAELAAQLAVDRFDELSGALDSPTGETFVFLFPDEQLQLQLDIEDEIYLALEEW